MKKKATKKVPLKINPVKLGVMVFLITFATFGAAYVYASSAAPVLPTGTIAIGANSTLKYGGIAYFDTSVTGKLNPKGYTYVRTVCREIAPGTATTASKVVYQWSKSSALATTEGFPLTDQSGQNLQWDGQAAECIAEHVYRIDGQKPTIHTMASTGWFTVSAQ